MKKFKIKLFLIPFVLLSLVSCKQTPNSSLSSKGDDNMSDLPYKHVVILGIDGAGANYQYLNTPTIDAVFSHGATTNKMKSSTPSMSAPCWGSMIHGVVPAKHKLTNSIAETTAYSNIDYPSIFKVAHDQNPNLKLASFVNWNAINIGIVEDDIGVYKYQNGNDNVVMEQLTQYIAQEKPNLVFAVLDNIDHTGHASGFGKDNSDYMNALSKVDGYVSSLIATLDESEMLEDTLLILTADHGGYSSNHGGIYDVEQYVFFGASGRNIESGTIGEMELRDVSAIVTHALNLKNPDTWTARVPDHLFKGVSNQPRPLGEKIKENTNLPSSLPDSTYAYFDFENNFEDIKQNVRSSYQLFENPAYKVAGMNGYGFNAYNGYLKLENLTLGTNNFSFGIYVEMADIRNDPVLFGNKNWTSGRNSGIVISARGYNIEPDIKFNIGNGTDRFDFSFPYPKGFLNGWTHLLFSFDRQNNEIRFYANFEYVGSFSLSEPFKNANFDIGTPYYIGNDTTQNLRYGLPAIIDDVAIFNKAFKDEDVAELKSIYNQ